MANDNAAAEKPVITVSEKRKFNWVVLVLLLAVIAVGVYWLLM